MQTLQLSCLFSGVEVEVEYHDGVDCGIARPLNYVVDCGMAWDIMHDNVVDVRYLFVLRDLLARLFGTGTETDTQAESESLPLPPVTVIGFSFHNDKPKLRELYLALQTHLGETNAKATTTTKNNLDFPGLVDLQTHAYNDKANQSGWTVGLRTLCKDVLGREMDKTWQCSDWAARPLSEEQLTYAALDADVLVRIYLKLLKAGY